MRNFFFIALALSAPTAAASPALKQVAELVLREEKTPSPVKTRVMYLGFLDADHLLLATVFEGLGVSSWDFRTNHRQPISGVSAGTNALTLTRDRKWLVYTDDDLFLRELSADRGRKIGHDAFSDNIEVSADAEWAATSDYQAGSRASVRMFSLATGEKRSFHPFHGKADYDSGFATRTAFSPDQTRLAVVAANDVGVGCNVEIWSTQKRPTRLAAFGAAVSVMSSILRFAPERGRVMTFTPAGDTLLVGCEQDIAVVDVASAKQSRVLHFRGSITAIAVDTNGRHVAAVSQNEGVRVFDLATGDVLAESAAMAGDGAAVEFSPDGTLLAVAFENHVTVLALPH
jgi:WD40 repeat protein